MNNILKSSVVSLIIIITFIPISMYVVISSAIYAVYFLLKELPHTIFNKIYNPDE